jgi:outer membrane receptor for ferrienterochelin and colicin
VFEVGHIKYFTIGTISSAIYHRNTQDKIDQIRTVDDDGNSVTVPENLNSELAYGLEFAATLTLTKWWKFDANFNFFYADIDGSNIDPIYTTTTYSWFSRQTSRFSLPGKVDFQVRTNYEAPQNTAQGKRKSLYYVDTSLAKDIFKGNGTLNLTVLDLFNSRVMRSIAESKNFYAERESQFRRRQINLTLSYRIKQSKPVGKPKGKEEEF